jgi:DNA polymerase III epsilon subunit-like protein
MGTKISDYIDRKEVPPYQLSRCFIDLETTGLEPGKHVILSAGFVLNYGEPELEVTILPTKEEWARAEPRALEVNGMTYDHLKKVGVPLKEAKKTILQWLIENSVLYTKAVFVGHNTRFDIGFLNKFLGPELRWGRTPIDDVYLDIIEDFKELKRKDPKLRNLRKSNALAISQALGVEPEPNVHNALQGARVAMRNYWALVKRRDELFEGKI